MYSVWVCFGLLLFLTLKLLERPGPIPIRGLSLNARNSVSIIFSQCDILVSAYLLEIVPSAMSSNNGKASKYRNKDKIDPNDPLSDRAMMLLEKWDKSVFRKILELENEVNKEHIFHQRKFFQIFPY